MNNVIKIMLVDDEELFRKGIAFMLGREKDFMIISEASNGKELLDYLTTTNKLPDIIIMDLKMPEINGIEATKIIQSKFPYIKIIALSSYNTKSFIANMIEIGASSYIVKNATPNEMIMTIKEVASKGFYYNEEVLKVIQEDIVNGNKKKISILDNEYLTQREKEVLECICKQMSTVEISEKLFISPRTVEGHRNNLLLKTESKNVAGLVVFAIQNKIIDLDNINFS
jgi:DNA-binding NarL/FixJ family response regulator